MTPTNFDLAPPPKTVDGLAAVPIDIQRTHAVLTFDGATQTSRGTATVDFVVGPAAGCPIFDLRQTITAATLDGTALAPAKLAHHDFGGGADAQLRVIDSALAAGSSHSLRVEYDLGVPQASTTGSYLPALSWTAGPRLRLSFGFTDLGAGRYLESWVPANLIYDQFELVLELRVLNTPVAHALITNGQVSDLAANHWSVAFGARSAAFSTLVELRAADAVQRASDTTTLPVSGTVVTIEAAKLVGGPADLATEIGRIKGFLADNETRTGRYRHGGRFVAFLHQGGMEYDGGTTTGTAPLEHETIHSWWGRGVTAASQADAWWDEAWTVYSESGASGVESLDFSDPPVQLSSRNPWVRVTPSASYPEGERLWRGVAAMTGAGQLRAAMADFYASNPVRPATTGQLEAHLVARLGEPRIVDAFDRFVYGFADPSPAPDLWIRDHPGHAGEDAWAGRFWDSPDLWIRNADDGGTAHQAPEQGQDNWFYARVRNRSQSATARHLVVTFNVKGFAGTQFEYPADFLPAIAATTAFELAPGASTVVKARWPAEHVPPAGSHVCWLAAVLTRSDAPAAGRHVWEHNNLAQKNLAVVDAVPDAWFRFRFVVNRLRLARPLQELVLIRPPEHPELEAVIAHRRLVDLFPRERLRPLEQSTKLGVPFAAGRRATLALPALRRQAVLELRLRVPREAAAGDVLRLDLLERSEGDRRVSGGIAVELRVGR